MKADTIIGIVGSVVLIGVMVGVFIYEYNNVEELDEDALRMEAFNRSSFGHLDAEGDLDGDGTPNYQDDDIDGDGLKNGVDDVQKISKPFSGSWTAATSEFGRHAFSAENGVTKINVETTINPTLPIALVQSFVVDVYVGGVLEASGTGPFELDGSLETIEVVLSTDQASISGDYEGSVSFTY